MAGVLVTSVAHAAGGKPSLLGATRDQVLAKLGEPKSNIVAGNREVLFFAGERLVLRDNRVVEEEPIEASAPRPAPAKPAADTQAAQPAIAANAGASAPSNAAVTNPATADAGAPNGAATGSTDATATPPPQPEPEVQIISVRPPSRTMAKPDVVVTPPPAAPATAASTTSPTAATPSEAVAARSGSAAAAAPESDTPRRSAPPLSRGDPEPTRDTAAAPVAAAPSQAEVASNAPGPSTPAAPSTATAATPAASASAEATVPVANAPAAAAKPSSGATQPAAPAATSSASAVATQEPAEPSSHSGLLYVAGLAALAAAGGFLVWRRRQRQIALIATSVSNTPTVTAAPAATGVARFTTDFLGKLEWKRFEELVVAYYNKTGVVATRTKSGPTSPVHVKISWKGEQRPFACVQCIAQPSGPIAPERVQALCDALGAEDIRRGYLVTSGKFSPPARDLAEEKHLTLMAGDTFAEKLNALPDPVRAELWKDATADDYSTPTCPKCEVKMTRGLVEPWSCPQCGTPLPK